MPEESQEEIKEGNNEGHNEETVQEKEQGGAYESKVIIVGDGAIGKVSPTALDPHPLFNPDLIPAS